MNTKNRRNEFTPVTDFDTLQDMSTKEYTQYCLEGIKDLTATLVSRSGDYRKWGKDRGGRNLDDGWAHKQIEDFCGWLKQNAMPW